MPYVLKGNCVHKKNPDGSPGAKVKCHPDHAKAVAHLKALYKNVPDAKGAHVSTIEEMTIQLAAMQNAPEEVTPTPIVIHNHINLPTWDPNSVVFATTPTDSTNFAPIRLYFQEGEKTPDGRIIDPNAVNFNRPPPYAIRLQTTQPESGGHAGAVVCGVITRIARDGLTIVADGILDLTQDAGRQAQQLITNRTMQTWSPDLGDAIVDTEENYNDEDPNLASGLDQVDHFIQATFLGATLCAMPALASAVVELLDDSGEILVPAPDRNSVLDTPTSPLLRYITDRADQETFTDEEIAACAAASAPPREFFNKQSLPDLQRYVSITPEGHFFGHAAGFEECHIGILDRCVTINDIADCRGEGSFEYAMPGSTICADGSQVATGPISIKGGHAPRGLPWYEALSHYDDPSAAVADVCYYMDEFGIQFTGAIRPNATEDQIRILRASGVSLDARAVDGKLRYLATCAVNTPGFPKASARVLAASAEVEPAIQVLIAPSIPVASSDN